MVKKIWIIGPKKWNFSGQAQQNLLNSIFFIDGGAKYLNPLSKIDAFNIPSFVIGDGDSFKGDEDEIEELFDLKYPREKDSSDFALGIKSIRMLDKKLEKNDDLEISLFGFHGGRLDHQIAIFGEIRAYLLDHPKDSFCLFDENNSPVANFFLGKRSFEYSGTFSLFSFEKTEVTIKGLCRYQDQRLTLNPLESRGLSNEAYGKFIIKSSSPLFIYWAEEEVEI